MDVFCLQRDGGTRARFPKLALLPRPQTDSSLWRFQIVHVDDCCLHAKFYITMLMHSVRTVYKAQGSISDSMSHYRANGLSQAKGLEGSLRMGLLGRIIYCMIGMGIRLISASDLSESSERSLYKVHHIQEDIT
jgi:hypothetical protein